jgi:hypothetical protein
MYTLKKWFLKFSNCIITIVHNTVSKVTITQSFLKLLLIIFVAFFPYFQQNDRSWEEKLAFTEENKV